jgi:dTDP-4-dehydrorhamnose 3,5-epimerase-like enzyme
MKTKKNPKIETKDELGNINGYLVPIYNIHDSFHDEGNEPQQVYLTVVKKGTVKGPHLHYIRTGMFSCIKGNVKIIVKEKNEYKKYFSGENHNFSSIIVPAGIPAMVQNIGDEDAFLLNMPSPAWTPEMNDEHTADFSDFVDDDK